VSRGTIIPQLLSCDTLADTRREALALTHRPFAPFRLILTQHGGLIEISYAEGELAVVDHSPLQSPQMFTSSGLGDAVVDEPRRALFQEMFRDAKDLRAQQDEYQRHFWPERRDVSVCMLRDRARTVSHTVLEIRPAVAVMTYFPQPPDQDGPACQISLRIA
jgi:hypothetical protein